MATNLDWGDLLGDTVREKYESLVVKIVELAGERSNILEVNAGMDIATIFDSGCSSAGFPVPRPEEPCRFQLKGISVFPLFVDSLLLGNGIVVMLKDGRARSLVIKNANYK